MEEPVRPDQCPRCGGPLQREKDTFSGNIVRDYYCPKCKWSRTVDEGPALWTILSEEQGRGDKA